MSVTVSDASIPRATVIRRYRRLVNRGIAIVASLVGTGLLAAMTFSETFPFLQYHGMPYQGSGADRRKETEARSFFAFLRLIIDGLRGCGLSIAAIRIAMATIFVLCVVAIVYVIIYVKRAAPPKAQRLQKKSVVA